MTSHHPPRQKTHFRVLYHGRPAGPAATVYNQEQNAIKVHLLCLVSFRLPREGHEELVLNMQTDLS